MFSKQEAGILKEKFWTSFGQYLAPIPSGEGQKINWINYKTGIKSVNFKMDASDHAYIGIELSHKDIFLQELFFNHFRSLKTVLEDTLAEKWLWEQSVPVNGKTISRIYTKLDNINIYRQADWPKIISFFKARIILLDKFWLQYKDIFEMLG